MSQCSRAPNGHCSHFCFPTPSSSRVCGCPYGMKLQANQMDCIKDDSVTPPDTSCGDYAFECDEGRCKPNSYRCDGIADCIDKTDEANCTDTGVGVNVCVCLWSGGGGLLCMWMYVKWSNTHPICAHCVKLFCRQDTCFKSQIIWSVSRCIKPQVCLSHVSLPHLICQGWPVLRGRSPATTSTASCPVGAVMAPTTAVMVLMKSTAPLDSPPPAAPTTLPVTTTGASPRTGCVTVTMTVVTALMSKTAVSNEGLQKQTKSWIKKKKKSFSSCSPLAS